MKQINILLLGIITLLITSCSGSDFYQGQWKAMDTDEAKYEISFEANNFHLKDATGETKSFEYKQISVNVTNGVKTYGIKISDGRNYLLHFPIPKDPSIGIIQDPNGHTLFTIGRDGFISYEDIYDLN